MMKNPYLVLNTQVNMWYVRHTINLQSQEVYWYQYHYCTNSG
jgi:hypothetical protein